MEKKAALKAKFLIPSILGIALFMVPVYFEDSWTILVKILADKLSGVIGDYIPILCLGIITLSAVMSLIGLAKPKFITESKIMKNTFECGPIWTVMRIIGCVAVWLTYLTQAETLNTSNVIIEAIAGADQGGLAFDLVCGLVIIFLFASFLLPLLLDFGLLEYVGAMLTKIMRPVFKVPGRAAVDCITSWIGDGTLGVMLTNNQYEGGYYNAKEATIIATTFSAVSITFSLVVLSEVGLAQYFGIYYLLICFVGVVCAIICPRLYPIRKKPETYLVEGNAMPDTIPAEFKSSHQFGMHLAMERVSKHTGLGEFFANGAKNCFGMWFGVLPTVMAIGTIALVLASYTPIFTWLGAPFVPLFNILGLPEAEAAAGTMVVGFTDMFTPAILIADNPSAITRFVVAVISITQVLFLDEVGGLILSSKLPINLWELFVIFIERTIISILIVVPISHLIFS